MDSRTKLSFPHQNNLWPAIEKWAPENGFNLKNDSGSERLYQKGVGFLVAPMMLSVRDSAQGTSLEAWIRVNTFTRAMGLFLIPAEMGIESGGFKLIAPRSIARNAINKLLPQLGQPLIP